MVNTRLGEEEGCVAVGVQNHDGLVQARLLNRNRQTAPNRVVEHADAVKRVEVHADRRRVGADGRELRKVEQLVLAAQLRPVGEVARGLGLVVVLVGHRDRLAV